MRLPAAPRRIACATMGEAWRPRGAMISSRIAPARPAPRSSMSLGSTPTAMPIYDRYAPLYDQSGQVRFALLTHMYLGELLARHPAPGRRALDLACGTGTLAAM